MVALLLACIIAWLWSARDPPIEPGPTSRPGQAVAVPGPGPRSSRTPLPIRTSAVAAGLTLSGWVETTSGEPVEGTRVGFWTGDGPGTSSNQQPDPIVETDAQGRFTMQVDEPGMLTVLDGASPSALAVDESQTNIVFRRGESCALEVQVVDPEGHPVPHYAFVLSYRDATMPADVVSQTTGPFQSDSTGTVVLHHAPCGRLQFRSARGDQAPLVRASVDTLLEQSVTLNVIESVRVQGTLVDAEDQPVAEGLVYVFWLNAPPGSKGIRRGGSTIGLVQEGTFEVQVPPEKSLRFTASDPGLEGGTQAHTAPALGEGPLQVHLRMRDGRVVTVYCSDDTPTCPPKQEPTCRWTDRATGEPVEESCILEQDRRHFTCVCGPEAAQIQPGAGLKPIEIDATQSEVILSSELSERKAETAESVRGTASLEVTLVNVDGAFYPASQVMLQIKSEGATPVQRKSHVASVASTLFSELPAGSYTVGAFDLETLQSATETVRLGTGEAKELELTIPPPP